MSDSSLQYTLTHDDQLCFVRIPKTGSTTLISILDAQFSVAEICPVLVGDLPQTTPEQLAPYRLFRDHFDYDIHQYLPRSPVYITMLRDPVSRAISHYEFCKRCPNQTPFDNYLREEAAKGLKAFVCHPDPTIRIRTSNLQTRQIAAGLGSRHGNPFEPSPLESQLSDADLFTLAKQHLDAFAFVGITEQFQDSILLLAYSFGWYPVAEYQSLRVATKKSKKDELDPDILEAILSVNQLDWELYQYGRSRFQTQFATMMQELANRYSSPAEQCADPSHPSQVSPQQVVTWLDHHYAYRYAEQQRTPVEAINYDFLQPLSGSGWHRRNGAYSGLYIKSLPFRWTGPGTESTLDFPLKTTTDLTVRIRITNAIAPDVLDSLQLQVNDTLIPLTVLVRRDLVAVLEGHISQESLRSNRPFTRLTFHVNRTLSLKVVNPDGTDDRVVGLAVHRLQIVPSHQSLQSLGYDSLLFPAEDPLWADTSTVVQPYLKAGEKVAAPMEFLDLYPHQFLPCSTQFSVDSDVAWVIVHKGFLDEIDDGSLQWTISKMHPVFANAVFVIFSNRLDIPALDKQSPHLQSFWATWNDLKSAKGGNPLATMLRRVRQSIAGQS